MMFKKGLLTGFATVLFALLPHGVAQATTCVDPAALEDPRILIEPCSAVIAASSTTPDVRIRALEYRARAYRFARDFVSALDDVGAGLALKSDDAALHSVRAMIHESRRDLPAAWSDAVKAIDLAPEDPLFLERLINLCVNYRLLAEAQELLEHAGKTFPGHLGIKLSKLGHFRARLDHRGTAAVLTDILATSTPAERDTKLLSWRGRMMRGDVPMLILLSEALLKDYQWDGALQAAEKAVAIRRDARTLTARAWVHESWPSDGRSPSRSPAALADIDAALEADPGFAHAHYVRGHILLYMERHAEALAATNEALRLEPADDTRLWQRFVIQRALGDLPAAESDLIQYASNPRNIRGVVQKLRPRGYWLEAEVPDAMTPVLKAGLRACAQDKACW